jgi:adenosine deaminase
MTKRSYVEAVLSGFEAAGVSPCLETGTKDSSQRMTIERRSDVQDKPKIYVRLLLSIDRRESAEAAMDTVRTYFSPAFIYSNNDYFEYMHKLRQ